MSTKSSAKKILNHAGLCQECKVWADEISGGNAMIQRRIGLFVERNLHKATHFELHSVWMHRRGYWPDLATWLGFSEVSEA